LIWDDGLVREGCLRCERQIGKRYEVRRETHQEEDVGEVDME
jgi:hypothetical protein